MRLTEALAAASHIGTVSARQTLKCAGNDGSMKMDPNLGARYRAPNAVRPVERVLHALSARRLPLSAAIEKNYRREELKRFDSNQLKYQNSFPLETNEGE